MAQSQADTPSIQARLGLWDAVSIIIGIVIGSTIYETPPDIFRAVSDWWIALALWGVGGLLALIGALCYAELATTYPRVGGDYNYQTRAYGPLVGYFFAWAQLVVIQTGSVGLMAFVFARYATRLWDFTKTFPIITEWNIPPEVVYAAAAVTVLSLLNLLGVVLGKITQNLLSLAKVLGLVGIIVAGFMYAPETPELDLVQGQLALASETKLVVDTPAGEKLTFQTSDKTTVAIDGQTEYTNQQKQVQKYTVADLTKPEIQSKQVRVFFSPKKPNLAIEVRAQAPPDWLSLALPMVLIMFAYGGWNDSAFVAAEVRNRRRNLPLALILGTLGVSVIYLLVNYAYLRALGFAGASESTAIAADVLKLVPWEYGEQAMTILVMVSALGALNGLLFTSARVYAILGADYSLFTPLGVWNRRLHSPVWSLLLQMVISLGLILLVGTYLGQDWLNQLFAVLNLERVDWQQSYFLLLFRCTSSVFWFFFLLTGLAFFVLRINDPNVERPFAAPLYPLLPLIFCVTCGFMLYESIAFAKALSLVGAALVLAGFPFYIFSRRRNPGTEVSP
jgi:amino acid transporter